MIAFTCASCPKKLTVKEELAGKKIKCPGCGQVMVVPDQVATPTPGASLAALAELRTLAPAGDRAADALSESPTAPPPSQSDATWSPHPESSDDSHLTAFLAPAQADDELGRLGGFRILKILGHGGMGVVFQGEDPKLGRKVAIKAMLPHLADSKSAQQRFLREARAAAALEHDHIVPILQIGEDRGAPFIVMPFLRGESLDGRLQREDKLPLTEVLRIGREIAAGLATAHERGLIHRDIKPGNVWLETRGESSAASEVTSLGPRVKILDFGLARASSGAQNLTQSGAIVGTPSYMAPEQAQTQDIDGRADLFSLGVVLYRLCTGQLPFRGHDTMSTLMALATHTPAPPRACNPDIPEELSELVVKLLAKDPAGRPASAKEVIYTLQAIEHRLATATQVVPVRPPGKSRKPLLLALGGALAAVVLVGIVLWWQTPLVPVAVAPPGKETTDPKKNEPNKEPPVKTAPEGPLLPKVRNDLGMEFVLVPKGTFWMGGGGGKPGNKQVDIPRTFYMGVHPVTQEQWQAVMDNNPSYFSRSGKGKDRVQSISDADLKQFPVEQVSWNDAQEFIKRLNTQEKASGWLYRLPTEAEWEYTCRGGATSQEECSYHFYLEHPSNSLSSTQANFNGNSPAGGAPKGPYLQRTSKVGSYPPNKLGICDMHANVKEWTSTEEGSGRFLRGGSWDNIGVGCTASYRYRNEPGRANSNVGFRLLAVPSGNK